MKPLSVEMVCLMGIQNEIQAVCVVLLVCITYGSSLVKRKMFPADFSEPLIFHLHFSSNCLTYFTTGLALMKLW